MAGHTHRTTSAIWHCGALFPEGAGITPDAEFVEELEREGFILPNGGMEAPPAPPVPPAKAGKGGKASKASKAAKKQDEGEGDELDAEIEASFPSQQELEAMSEDELKAYASGSLQMELDSSASPLEQVTAAIAQLKAQRYADKEQ